MPKHTNLLTIAKQSGVTSIISAMLVFLWMLYPYFTDRMTTAYGEFYANNLSFAVTLIVISIIWGVHSVYCIARYVKEKDKG